MLIQGNLRSKQDSPFFQGEVGPWWRVSINQPLQKLVFAIWVAAGLLLPLNANLLLWGSFCEAEGLTSLNVITAASVITQG